MTEKQCQFAEQQHNLIYAFLNEKGLTASEYYDIAAWGYLRAVRRYLTEPQLQQYAFSTIAWRAMRQSVAAFHRSEMRRKRTEQAFANEIQIRDPMEKLESRLLLHDLALVASEEQYSFAKYRLQGYSVSETAAAHGVSAKWVRRLLKNLYRTYVLSYLSNSQ